MAAELVLIDSFFVPEPAYRKLADGVANAVEACDTIGSLVRPIRRRLDWSQGQLAEHVGMPVSRLQKVEKREARPSIDDAEVLLKWIGAYAPIQPELPVGQPGVAVVDLDEDVAPVDTLA